MIKEIIKCGILNGKQVYGLKRDGEVVLTSTNRARVFAVCFNVKYLNKDVNFLLQP